MKIENLCLMPNTFGIEGKITATYPIKKWINENGEGKIFNFDLSDDSGTIRLTAFRNQAEKLEKTMKLNEVYKITNCKIKMASELYTKEKYEIIITKDTEIIKSSKEISIPEYTKDDFNTIEELYACNDGCWITIIARICELNSVEEFISKSTGKPLKKRDIKIKDETGSITIPINICMFMKSKKKYDFQ